MVAGAPRGGGRGGGEIAQRPNDHALTPTTTTLRATQRLRISRAALIDRGRGRAECSVQNRPDLVDA